MAEELVHVLLVGEARDETLVVEHRDIETVEEEVLLGSPVLVRDPETVGQELEDADASAEVVTLAEWVGLLLLLAILLLDNTGEGVGVE